VKESEPIRCSHCGNVCVIGGGGGLPTYIDGKLSAACSWECWRAIAWQEHRKANLPFTEIQ